MEMDQGQNVDTDLPLLKTFNQNDVFALDTVIYSTFDPQDLFDALQGKLQDLDLKFVSKPNKFKLSYNLHKDPISNVGDSEPKECGSICVKAKITEIDAERIALEFTKLSGSAFLFHEHVQHMKDLLDEFNDAPVEEQKE